MDNNEIHRDIESTGNTTPSPMLPRLQTRERATEKPSWSWPLHVALEKGNWDDIKEILDKEPEAIYGPVGSRNDTPLIVAIENGLDMQIIKNLVDMMLPEKLFYSFEEISLSENRGSAIHCATLAKNYSAVKLLVSKNPAMLNCLDYQKQTPIQLALYRERTEMAYYLLELASIYIQDVETHPTDAAGTDLLEHAVGSRMYDFASLLVQQYPKLAPNTRLWRTLMIDRCEDLASRGRLNWIQSLIYLGTATNSTTVSKRSSPELDMVIIQSWRHQVSRVYTQLKKQAWRVFNKLVPTFKDTRLLKLKHHEALEFVRILCVQIDTLGDLDRPNDVRRMFNSAVQNGMSDIVKIILDIFPDAIEYKDDDGYNALQFAVSYRDGKLFRVIHERISLSNNRMELSLDNDGNNILHLVAKRARRNKHDAGSKEVLQLRGEFQWYKTVEKLCSFDLKFQKNVAKKLPLEVFDEEHQDMLLAESEWMRYMANSCMIVGSLIATVVFAAAITLPGGNMDDGFPNFSKRSSFKVFAFSNVSALISSITTVLIFLSIFITRDTVESFQYDLPNKMIIGLVFLLCSVTLLMIAFNATVHLLLLKDHEWIIYPTMVASVIPLYLFLCLLLPSLVSITEATYFGNIFKDDYKL